MPVVRDGLLLAFICYLSRAEGFRRCDDSCPTANDGVCDDGGMAQLEIPVGQGQRKRLAEGIPMVLSCEFGTDCSDCRPLQSSTLATLKEVLPSADLALLKRDTASAHPEGGARSQGVALLRERGIEVRAAVTRTQPRFMMTYTDPSVDVDVSGSMHQLRIVEARYSYYFAKLSRRCCAAGGLMLDVGANFGYYSLLAAKMGCRVIAWEPVPTFRAFFETAAALNNLSHRIHIRHSVVSDLPGRNISLTVPLRGIWGTASIQGANVDSNIKGGSYTLRVPTETLDQVVRERACAMKLDVEGHEPAVLLGAGRFLQEYAPEVILKEYTPGTAERRMLRNDIEEPLKYPASLRALHNAGYKIWHIGPAHEKSDMTMVNTNWSTSDPLPPLPEVTNETIAAEERSFSKLVAARRGSGVFNMPWDLHPRSLHAEFTHNTDLLLTRASGAISRRRLVGLTADEDVGLGGVFCSGVRNEGRPQETYGRLCSRETRREDFALAVAAAEDASRGGASWSVIAQTRIASQRFISSPQPPTAAATIGEPEEQFQSAFGFSSVSARGVRRKRRARRQQKIRREAGAGR